MEGRVFMFNTKIELGQHINIDGKEGIIQRIRRLGIVLATEEGSKFIYYSKLMNGDYTLLKGKSTGSFHQLLLSSLNKEKDKTQYGNLLKDRLMDCPYLDWSYMPEIKENNSTEEEIILKILMNKDSHLEYFLQWLNANGFDCRNIGKSI